MIIAVDFDGTLCEHNFPFIGPDIGAFEWLHKFQSAGAKLILWTMRSDNQDSGDVLWEAIEHCKEQGIEFWGINTNPEQLSWTTSPKCYANLTIDDNNFGIPLVYPKDGRRPYVDWDIVGPVVMEKINGKRNK